MEDVIVVKVVKVSVDTTAEEKTELAIEEAILDAILLPLWLDTVTTTVDPDVVTVVDAAAVLVAVVKEIKLPPLDSNVTV